MSLYRLCYASQSIKPDHLIRHDLMDIINAAVVFNTEHHIFGVLYYGQGYFFQCLEGEKEQVDHVFQTRIQLDKRHQNIKVLDCVAIADIQFNSWNMKFAPYEKALMQLFEDHGKSTFNPYLLQPNQLQDFLNRLYLH